MHLATIFLFCVCTLGIGSGATDPPPGCDNNADSPIPIQVRSENGEAYNLKLVRAAESVLHPNIKVISVQENAEGQHSFSSWSPSSRELRAAQDIYIDEKNLAAIRFKSDQGNNVEMEGVVDGRRLVRQQDGESILSSSTNRNHSDYIDIKRNISASQDIQGGTLIVVELLLVCDKEFGDLFSHDRREILDYFTVYFWDVNMRYKTLSNSAISFRITGIVIISSPSGQPFIEEARGPDGRADMDRILPLFANWAYDQMGSLPKFDLAMAITNTELEWGGGLAYFRTACHIDHLAKGYYGTLVINDDGGWGSVTIGAHEIGHLLGAPHDDDPEFPGGCDYRGFIMGGASDELRWFFSPCSDRTISDFARSNEASCLRRLDETSQPAIEPDFSSVSAPTMDDQCRRLLNNRRAFVSEEDQADCKVMKCRIRVGRDDSLVATLPTVDNTICKDGGRCFRGRCRQEGFNVINVGSRQCMKAPNPFKSQVPLFMEDCVRPGTPLDRFTIMPNSRIGNLLATPYSTSDARENEDRCIYTGNEEGGLIWTGRCNPNCPWFGWDFIDVGNDEFLLSHRPTKRCAKAVRGLMRNYENCDRNDPWMRWKLEE